MTMMLRLTLAGTALVAGMAVAAAQPAQDHSAHHPAGQTAAPAQTPGPRQMGRGPAQPGGNAAAPGMMGGGGMAQMGDMAKMMGMMMSMRDGMASPSDMGWFGGHRLRHVEGQIAFLKAELKITDAQAPQWNAFADALRAVAAAPPAMAPAAGPATAPEVIERRITQASTRLDTLKSLLAAVKPLYAALSDEQKQTADGLLAEHMAMPRGAGPAR